MPVTMPVELIDAIAVLLLLHVPPLVALVSVVVLPTQVLAVPAIVAGVAFTVTINVERQPVPNK